MGGPGSRGAGPVPARSPCAGRAPRGLIADGSLVPVTVEGLRGLRLVVASDLPMARPAIDEVAPALLPAVRAPV